ncbi:MAG TPA: GNAT family N-acetyltransferase [Bryobacteraceae bacterium]|nr:GNAT family N-acetyltransferase [Bryobacteraceae bacterium]
MEFESVASNLRQSFRVVAAHRAGGELREMEGVSIASAGVAFQMFNAAFLSAPVSSELQLDRRAAQAAVHFAARGQRWAYWICHGWLESRARKRLQPLLHTHHLYQAVELPGMLAETLLPPARQLPPVDVRRVSNGPVKDAFCAIGSLCFNVPLPWFCEVFDGGRVWDEFAAYVGYVNGQPVSTAATVIGGGVVGVYNVATLPDHRRGGFGEAVMRHALEQARLEHGLSRSILQSTPQGFELYRRMGYRTVTSVAVFCS